MSAVQYPFIDMAVHESVRERFALGEAIVLFSPDMASPLWANGRGAGLFGFASIYDFLDQGPNKVDIAFRQADAAARQLAAVGDIRRFTIRVASGFQRVPVQAVCELISVQGETAVLFSAPAEKGRLPAAASAARMIEGFDDPDTHMAVIDDKGAIVAASAQFAGLGISDKTTAMLATMVASDASRLVKRPIPTAKGYLPAAIGKLSDEPALNLLFTVETAEADDDEVTAPPADAAPTMPTGVDDYAEAISAVSEIEDTDEPSEEISLETGGMPAGAIAIAAESAGGNRPAEEMETAVEIETVEHTVPEPHPVEMIDDDAPADIVSPAAQPEEAAAEADAPAGFVFRRDGRATRFVWKIDAEGRFSEVSSEFADAVGPHAADINGMAFTDLAALFNLDPEGRIGELLGKRDTWSGKTIWWPVEGTSLIVPVDLAALPTYTRTREFDGFRGFGIVRIGDAAEDPNAIGLTLTRAVPEDVAGPDVSSDVEPEAVEMPAEDAAGLAEAPISISEVSHEHAPAPAEEISGEAGQAPGHGDLTTADVAADSELSETIGQDNSGEQGSGEQGPNQQNSDRQAASQLDWPSGERPALRIVENPGRRHSDKVIQLEERRSNRRDGLTAGEQAAFKEIARQLDNFVARREEDGRPPVAAEPQAPVTEPTKPADAAMEPVAIDPAQDPHALMSAEQAPPPVEGHAEGHGEASATSDAGQPEGPLPTSTEDLTEAEAEDFAHHANEAFEEPVEPPATDEHQNAHAEEPADPHPELSDRELLGQMIPVRERPGLSAEIVDQMPVALLVHSGDLLIHANPEFLRLTGYPSVDDLAEVGGLDALLQRQELEDKSAEAGNMLVVRADDAVLPVTARLQSVRWGDTTALMLALMPVSAQIQAVSAPSSAPSTVAEVIPLNVDAQTGARPADQLARLQVEVEELRAILETATDGVVLIGADGDIRSLNRAASALFNYDNDEINGKPFVTLFAHESQRAILDYLSGLAGHGVASVLNDGREVIGREASGGFLPLFMTIGRLTSSNGYCAVIRDITQWKRTEDELRTAKRAAETANAHKSEFLAHVSHEIRTPLNAIIGFSDMMATERFGTIGHPRYVEYANDIGRSGRHVLDIVNDLLDISKIEAGEMDLDFIAVGLNETVSEAVSLVQPQANGQRVIIRTALSHSVPQVVADLRSIKQIVLNILSNAIRFTPSGGQIVVSTAYESNGSVVLRVRDTGIGMTRSELELAMKPFRQVAGGTRKRGDGTGLGLPLTKAMVDANRAAFSITSAPNEGTLVEITFPSQRVLAN